MESLLQSSGSRICISTADTTCPASSYAVSRPYWPVSHLKEPPPYTLAGATALSNRTSTGCIWTRVGGSGYALVFKGGDSGDTEIAGPHAGSGGCACCASMTGV